MPSAPCQSSSPSPSTERRRSAVVEPPALGDAQTHEHVPGVQTHEHVTGVQTHEHVPGVPTCFRRIIEMCLLFFRKVLNIC